MKNQEIAHIFENMADILELQGEISFKVNAYRGRLAMPLVRVLLVSSRVFSLNKQIFCFRIVLECLQQGGLHFLFFTLFSIIFKLSK